VAEGKKRDILPIHEGIYDEEKATHLVAEMPDYMESPPEFKRLP